MTSTEKPRSWLGPSVLGLLVTGGAALIGLRSDWSSTLVTAPGVPEADVTVPGSEIAVGAVGLAIVIMASALGVLAGSPRVRRWLGVVTVLVGLAAAGWAAVASGADAQSSALDAAAVSGADTDWSPSFWRWVTVVAFLASAMVAALVAWQGPRWPTMGTRYEAPKRSAEPDASDLWKSLDEGIDPTE